MTKQYNTLVFIGRFQPFHLGHKRVIDHALTIAENVLVLIGSANRSRSTRNPFTYEERAGVIFDHYHPEEYESVPEVRSGPRVIVKPLDDMMYSDTRWVEQVQAVVQKTLVEIANPETPRVQLHGIGDRKVGLIGANKDGSSYYLKMFPTWGSVGIPVYDDIDAVDIRTAYWHRLGGWASSAGGVYSYVPETTYQFLRKFSKTKAYGTLRDEIEFTKNYKESVKQYPRIEQTVDAVVIQSGHVLLIRRRALPGKGLWALPGGFLNPDEKLLDGAVRELREETKIKVAEPVLRGNMIMSRTFDDPHRSSRGRIITAAFLFMLPSHIDLPKVKGSDDADKARWVPFAELSAENLFEDHYWVIQTLLDGSSSF